MTGRLAGATEDNEVFVDHAGRIDVHRYRAWISPKVLTQVDLAGIAKLSISFPVLASTAISRLREVNKIRSSVPSAQ